MVRQPARISQGWSGLKNPPAVAFVGWSGSGKTTLIERVIPLLRARGLKVGYLKSDVHGFDMDRKGKDTARIFDSGAERVAIASPTEGALRFRLERKDPHALLAEHFSGCDGVVVEGFKGSDLSKIEVVGETPAVARDDPALVALVTDRMDPRPVPRFSRDDPEAVADFVAALLMGTMTPPS